MESSALPRIALFDASLTVRDAAEAILAGSHTLDTKAIRLAVVRAQNALHDVMATIGGAGWMISVSRLIWNLTTFIITAAGLWSILNFACQLAGVK